MPMPTPTSFNPSLTKSFTLEPQDSWPAAHHRFDQETVWAVQTALSIRRPLLLRGEPGIGKSQLARAVAQQLGVPFLYHVVDERSERDDLLHAYDAVARLAEAQVCGLVAKDAPKDAPGDWRARLAERNFIRPGVLWWAFDWKSAEERAADFYRHLERKPKVLKPPKGWLPGKEGCAGPVVLIDEIDKADPSVPNGLLECLGNDGFQTAQLGEAVRLAHPGQAPLIIITTNEERDLPAAFLRRCLVLQMRFPKEHDAAVKFLLERGTGVAAEYGVSEKVQRLVGEVIVKDREDARGRVGLPGAAEYLELLRALAEHARGDDKAQEKRLGEIQKFVLQKHDSLA